MWYSFIKWKIRSNVIPLSWLYFQLSKTLTVPDSSDVLFGTRCYNTTQEIQLIFPAHDGFVLHC